MIETAEIESVTEAQAERWGAKYTCEPIPTFASKADAEKYRDKEEERFFNGHKGLLGSHYKYIQHYKIKDGYGSTISPNWRDTDDFIIFKTEAECKAKKTDKFTLKRREIGLSTTEAFELIETALLYPGCVCNVTSYKEDAVEKLMKQKVAFLAQNAFSESELEWKKVFGAKAQLWKPTVKYNEAGMFLKFVDEGIGSMIQGIQTTNGEKSAKNMEGDRIMRALIDEFFLNQFASKVRASADASRKMGFSNVGRISMGGSAGGATADGAAKAQQIWYDHEKLGIDIVFIPGWMSIDSAPVLDSRGIPISGQVQSFTKNGWSIKDKAIEWIEKTRSVLKSLQDKTDYYQFLKAYPLYVEEIFETTGDDSWSPDEKVRFEEQKKRIFVSQTHKFEPKILDELPSGIIVPRRTNESPIQILEPPVAGEEYIAGTDPIPIVTRKESDDTSDYAMAIFRRSTRKVVAYYQERSKDASRLVGNSIKLQKLFNRAPTFMERNRADAILMEYDRRGEGLHKLIVPEPAIWRPQGAKSIEPGYYKSIHNADQLDNFLLEWARWYDEERKIGGIEGIWNLHLWENVIHHNVGNKDLGDAIKSVLAYDWWLTQKELMRKAQTQKSATKKMVYINTMENGRPVQKAVPIEDTRLPRGFTPLSF